jgi:hypothetical protein
MGLTLAEVEGLAMEGWLDWQARGGDLWVRPVVLSRLRVVDERVAEHVDVDPESGLVEPPAPVVDPLDGFGRSAA